MGITQERHHHGIVEIVVDCPPVNALTVAEWFQLADELTAARTGTDTSVFTEELINADRWRAKIGEYLVAPGVHAITSPGHTAGHMSVFIELPKRGPVILCGDAADLEENLSQEIAPGCCWQDNGALALASIRKLKELARTEGAELWPNHDMAFFQGLPAFPAWRD